MSPRRNHPIAPVPDGIIERSQRDHSRFDDIAGHRVMRRFAVGTRGTLLLAHRSSPSEHGSSRPHLLKVFHSDTPVASVDVELTALSSIAAPHIARLIDVASVETGEPPCLVLEKLPGPALSSYLADESSVTAGQAVTILGPLCSTLQALHDAGVTHGGIHPRRIVFDHRGAPTLTGFGRGMLREAPHTRRAAVSPQRVSQTETSQKARESSWRTAVLDDQRDLLAVVAEVLLAVDSGSTSGSPVDVHAMAQEIGAGPSREFLPRLESALFALASPQVVAVAGAGAGAESDVVVERRTMVTARTTTSSATADYDWAQPQPSPPIVPAENRLVAVLRVLGASSAALETVSSLADSIARMSARRRSDPESSTTGNVIAVQSSPQRRVRRPLLLGASCLVLVTTVLLLSLPSPGDEAQAGASDVQHTSIPATASPTGQPASPETIDDAPAVQGDDAAEALRALSSRNDRCQVSSHVDVCRESVFQPDYLATLSAGESRASIDAVDAIITGSWGGSALVAARLNDQPASFLLMKGETGWRVRDVFVSEQ